LARQLEAIVHGRVQGVSFRYYTRLEAQRLGVTGWAANQRDGTVIVIAQGSDESLERLISYLRHGPAMARVDKLEIRWVESSEAFTDFGIRVR